MRIKVYFFSMPCLALRACSFFWGEVIFLLQRYSDFDDMSALSLFFAKNHRALEMEKRPHRF
jgi:hypothetical protein